MHAGRGVMVVVVLIWKLRSHLFICTLSQLLCQGVTLQSITLLLYYKRQTPDICLQCSRNWTSFRWIFFLLTLVYKCPLSICPSADILCYTRRTLFARRISISWYKLAVTRQLLLCLPLCVPPYWLRRYDPRCHNMIFLFHCGSNQPN